MGFVVLFLHDEHGFSTGEAAAVFAVGQGLAAALRIGVGRWSGPARLAGAPAPRHRRRHVAVTLAAVAVLAGSPAWVLVPALVLATGMSMAWNGLSYTIAAGSAGAATARVAPADGALCDRHGGADRVRHRCVRRRGESPSALRRSSPWRAWLLGPLAGR